MRLVKSTWVFSYKLDEDGTIAAYKARLVAKGCSQRPCADYTEVFVPTGKQATLRALLTYVAIAGYTMSQGDYSAAFTNGELEEEILMQQPPHFDDGSGRVWRLRRALYGLKQAARAWHKVLRRSMGKLGFAPFKSDPAVFVRSCSQLPEFVFTHVDDIIAATPTDAAHGIIKQLLAEYPGTAQGEPRIMLGVLIERDWERGRISLSQPQLILALLERHGMAQCAARSTPIAEKAPLPPAAESKLQPLEQAEADAFRHIVGSCTHICRTTRPDLSYACSVLAAHYASPSREVYDQARHMLRYLRGTQQHRLVLGNLPGSAVASSVQDLRACIYADADFANCTDTRRSITGYVLQLGSAPIAWASRKQSIVTKSTMGAEIMAASTAIDELPQVIKLLQDMGIPSVPTLLRGDNQSAVQSLQSESEDKRSKYIDIHYHAVRERVGCGDIEMEWIATSEMKADILTKALPRVQFEKGRTALGVLPCA